MATPSDDKNGGGISADTSKRVCQHMNEDHSVSVYAMAKSLLPTGYKIISATLVSVSMEGCTIAAAACQGDLCEQKHLMYPFNPPMSSGSEVRKRMVDVHHAVCTPNISWLVTHSDALAVLIVMALLGYGTHVIGSDQLAANIEGNASLNSLVSAVFGSAAFFSKLVQASWIFALVAHAGEGLYVAYKAQSELKLQWKSRLLWFGMVCTVGYPITKEFLDLLKVHQKQPKKDEKGH